MNRYLFKSVSRQKHIAHYGTNLRAREAPASFKSLWPSAKTHPAEAPLQVMLICPTKQAPIVPKYQPANREFVNQFNRSLEAIKPMESTLYKCSLGWPQAMGDQARPTTIDTNGFDNQLV